MESVRNKEVKCHCNLTDFHEIHTRSATFCKELLYRIHKYQTNCLVIDTTSQTEWPGPHMGRSYPSQGRTKMDVVYDNMKKRINARDIISWLFSHDYTVPDSPGLHWSHSDSPHTAVILWTNDQPDAEISTWKHTTLTRNRHPYPQRDSNPQFQQACGSRPTP